MSPDITKKEDVPFDIQSLQHYLYTADKIKRGFRKSCERHQT
jgi:hypothetical protein